MKRYVVLKRTSSGKVKHLGGARAMNKTNATRTVKGTWGKSAYVREVKY